ncbi:amidohydrolase family protein [Amycolatopsis nigrescens]|uniref:amidohydrolase family protein n=1 Tax=Amycolatopsis nigrescens TaxID=381445 RepID=UPI000370F881|nr:amidohydrolase family protein [Amycolatopsis nigrescens]
MREDRYLIRGGSVLSMDPVIGDFEVADVLTEGTKILAVGPNLEATAEVIDATGTIVMPGFVDTHHHQYQAALRGALPEGMLSGYFEFVNRKMSPLYRPEDVRIAELVASVSQLDAGVTTAVDTSQISLSPEHTDAAIEGLAEAGRRTLFTYSTYPVIDGQVVDYERELKRLTRQYFPGKDQLLTLGLSAEPQGEFRAQWNLARELGLPIVSHVLGQYGASELLVQLSREGMLGPDNEYIHATGLSDEAWAAIRDSGGGVSLAVPIEMSMRHGMPPILKALEMGVQPSLSVDVECTMTADFFTQLRSVYTLQRAFVHERSLAGEDDLPALLTPREVLRFATVEGARTAQLADRVGTLTPGKEADVILLRADALNVMPLNNVPGAVVTLMERSNVDTVLVAGKVRKRGGVLTDVDLAGLRRAIEASRDHLYAAAGEPPRLFA